jgi:hypothetical protein
MPANVGIHGFSTEWRWQIVIVVDERPHRLDEMDESNL